MNRTEILRKIRDSARRYGAKTELAQALGYTRATIRQKLKKDDGFTDDELRIAAAALVGAAAEEYLEKIEGPAPAPKRAHRGKDDRINIWIGGGDPVPRVKSESVGKPDDSGVNVDLVLIPRYDVAASAGPGAFADREQVVDYMAFREDFVLRVLRADPKNLVLLTSTGDSMMPTINSGDLLLIDRGVDRIVDDAIYVLVKGGELVVKRVQKFFNGTVVVKSDNPAYAPEELGPSEADQVAVAGRLRWIARMI